MTTPYFQPSLHVPTAGKYVVVVSLAATTPAAWLYAWATAPGPSGVNLLYALGLSLWLALVAHCVAAFGKIRHPQWMGLAGALIGVAAWYIHWAAWIAVSGQAVSVPQDAASSTLATAAYLCLRPDLVLGAAAAIAGSAAGVLGAAALVVVWLVELCAFALPPALAGARRASAPFCEQTGSWAKEVHVPVDFHYIQDPEAVRRRLERDPGALTSVLVPCADDMPLIASVTIHRCRGDESFVTICNFGVMAPSEVPVREIGKLSEAMPDKVQCYGQVDEPVVELLRFPAADVDALIRQWEQAAGALEPRVSAT